MRPIAAMAGALLATLTLVTVSSVHVEAESPVALTVRLYNSAGVAPEVMRLARSAAEPILRDAGMDVTFRQCGRVAAVGLVADLCDDSLKSSEVAVRVINAPLLSTTLHPDAYGVTYIVEDTNRGWLATVFSDRIAGVASRVDVAPGVLLGRVMAHEVGHLLLGSGYHGDAGVMRAEWPDALLSRATAAEWRFSMFEAMTMQRAVAASRR